MKIISRNMKTGVMKLRAETPEDVWHLGKILEAGDLVTAETTRRTTIKRGDEIIKGDRKPITITIALEKMAMESGRLRLRGLIAEGPDDIEKASYHSLSIRPRMAVTVKKQKWRRDQLDRLAKAGTAEPSIFICVLDREEADFASLSGSGVEMSGSIASRKVLGREDDRSEYYANVAKAIAKEAGSHDSVIVAGPGFEKENLFNYIKEKLPELVKCISVENASHTGEPGIREVIKTSANMVMKGTRVAKETGLVERLLAEMGRDGLATYGVEQVRRAALAGAVDTLLVSEENVPGNEGLMDAVESMRGKVFIISSSHDAGERFLYLGGVAAFLRYKPE